MQCGEVYTGSCVRIPARRGSSGLRAAFSLLQGAESRIENHFACTSPQEVLVCGDGWVRTVDGGEGGVE